MADDATTPEQSSDVTPEATTDDNNTTPDATATAASNDTNDDNQGGDTTPESGTAETPDDTTDDAKAATTEDAGEGEPDDAEDDDLDDSDDDSDDTSGADAKYQRSLKKARREASNLRTRLKDAESKANRYEVAMRAGIPSDAMEFLQGDSLEAMEESAEKLLVMMGYHGRVTPPGGPVETGGNPRRGDFTKVNQARQTTDLDTIGSRIYNQN